MSLIPPVRMDITANPGIVSREEYEAHKEECNKKWEKVDKVYDMVLQLRMRILLLVAFLSGLMVHFAESSLARSFFSLLGRGLFG